MATEQRPPLHVLIYGDPGAGKSTFAATFPTPMVVKSFDPFGKEEPYRKYHKKKKGVEILSGGVDEWGTPYDQIVDAKGNLLVQIEQYADLDPEHPDAWGRFTASMSDFVKHYEQWATVVFDSATFAEASARMYQKYFLNPGSSFTKHALQWWAGSTDDLERIFMLSAGAMRINVVLICHVSRDKDELLGTFMRMPAAPGRLGKAQGLPAGYSELYYAFAQRNSEGNREYLLQTASDGIHFAETHIDAPDPCMPHFQALWENFQ